MACLRSYRIALAATLLFVAHLPLSLAEEGCTEWAARLVSIQGRVEQRTLGGATWTRARTDARLCPGDALRTGANSRAAVLLQNETLVRLDQLTTVNFPEPAAQEQNFLLDIIEGVGFFFSRTPKRLEFRSPFVNAAVEGTEFLVSAEPKESRVLVLDGVVRASNAAGELRLRSGEGAVAGPGETLQRILVADPDNAVQWALHYPPVIDAGTSKPDASRGIADAAIEVAARGDVPGALEELKRLPGKARNTSYFSYRASLLLYVGRVEEARAAAARALEIAPDDSDALAVQSVIALVLNDRDAAQRLAEQGAGAPGPQGASAQIALSYVHQSRFDLDRALIHARRATELSPRNPLAWARLAEINLALGNRSEARTAAQTSIELNPNIARTQTTLGFAHLARFEAEQAAAAFQRASVLDQADPLPRLGLGIARIRRGQLAEGRRQIEIAASLGARSSIYRSYLGKAYFDERRDARADNEYRLAQELDPKDPTPWFYGAILKQTQNRPGEALRDLERSIALNDNRAVYRSSLLLDSDLAARSASQARIYEDLGFQRRALVEGWSSVNLDPGNWSAHRLLADTYSRRPRRNAARVSELFQSLMYQPINTLPLQPQQGESSLPIVAGSGPTDVALNEFHPLFNRDGVNLLLDGAVGNNNTWGNNLVLYGARGRFSGSLGQFHYETDGFRENNGQDEDIYNAFVQVAVNPALSLQAEYRRRETKQGDLRLNFDPEDFSHTLERSIEQDTARVGARFEVAPSSEILLSGISATRDQVDNGELDAVPFDLDTESDAAQGEAQYVFRGNKLSIIGGAAYNDIDEFTLLSLDLTAIFGEPCPAFLGSSCDFELDLDSKQRTGYLYANISLPDRFLWTLGLSYDDLEFDELDFGKSQIYPKAGVQWNLTDAVKLRAAYFKALKPALVVEQILQPTQVAGFTQFFDDNDATESEVFGLGLDARVTPDLFVGVEGMHRDVDTPTFGVTSGVTVWEREEDFLLGYAYWKPSDRWALSAEFEYEDISKRGDEVFLGPDLVRTTSLPLGMRYFHPRGFFGALTGTFVDQTVRQVTSAFEREDESFWVLDLELGYRIPKRSGILSLEVRNLLDEEFLYQDYNFLLSEPVPSRYVPDRTIVAKLSLSFDALFGGSRE